MSNTTRLVVLVTALASLFAVLSSTAGATTFTNSGATSFTATAGHGSLLVTGTPNANTLTCRHATASGSVASGTFTQIVGAATFTNCTLIGLHVEVGCNYVLTPTTFVAPVTTVSVSLNCVTRLATSPFTALCNITGPTPGTYNNPSFPTPGRLTLASSNSLLVSNSSDASCSSVGVPTGMTRTGHLSEQTFTLASAAGSPVITSP